ncbi:MAG: DUF1847 domain-containing protein [Brotaphodocola sp.]
MYTCANCNILACASEKKENLPKNCPMRQDEMMLETLKAYDEPENHDFYVQCSCIEAEGYGQWPRLKETLVLCKKLLCRRIL